MPLKRAKIFIIIVFLFLAFFFSNDFGLIDIEKTAIITAVAVDYGEDSKYQITAQIAVPEASDVSSENAKAHVIGKGATVGSAIKNVGDISGWFPNLSFCNLIILGKPLAEDNVMTVLDYFTKTLRIQDSAIVVLADGKAGDLITKSTPLDNISSFALQKILLKNPGHDKDTATVDIKTFCSGYYSDSHSSFMPLIKLEESKTNSQDGAQSGGNSGQGGNSGGLGALGDSSSGSAGSDSGLDGKGKTIFNGKTTALFKNGKMVGELLGDETFIFNMLSKKVTASTLEITDVSWMGEKKNFLITLQRVNPKIKIDIVENQPTVKISLEVFCKISDQNTETSDFAYTENIPLPLPVQTRATEQITAGIDAYIKTLINTDCDMLNLKLKLYRYHYDRYSSFKDNLLSVMNYTSSVTVHGQK